MNNSSNDAIASYFDDLFTETPRVESKPMSRAQAAGGYIPKAMPVDAIAEAKVAVFEVSAELEALQESKKRQLQALLNSQLLQRAADLPPPPSPEVETHAAEIITAQEAVLETPAALDEPHVCGKIRREYLAWADNGRPVWAQNRFDVLLFEVAGLTLAVPLIALGQIYRLTDQLSPVFGQINWFMGFQPTPAGAVRTVDTAMLVMPERYNAAFAKRAKYVVTIDGLDWGLAVDAVHNPLSLQQQDVTWRSQRSKRPWLAGTVKSAMCALIDIPQLGVELESHDRNRRPGR